MSRLIIAVLIYIVISSSSCERFNGWDGRLKFNNNSEKSIYYAVANTFPDTLIPGSPPLPNPTHSPETHKIFPHTTNGIPLNGTWETTFSKIQPPGKLVFFAFDAEILENTNWDTVRAKNMVLKRYELTLDSIKKLNWVITYP